MSHKLHALWKQDRVTPESCNYHGLRKTASWQPRAWTALLGGRARAEVICKAILLLASSNTPGFPSQRVLRESSSRYNSQPESGSTDEEVEAQRNAVTWPRSLHAIVLVRALEIRFFYAVCLRNSPDVSIKAQWHASLLCPTKAFFSNLAAFTDTGRKSQDHRKAN